MSCLLIFGLLAILSLALNLWQWFVAGRFPLHRPMPVASELLPVTLLKPLKGIDSNTRDCLRSWFTQEYAAPLQMLFAVKEQDDPAFDLVKELLEQFPDRQAKLLVCPKTVAANPKVSTLMQLEDLIEGEVVVISDADVKIAPDYLAQAITLLKQTEVGMVTSFHRAANPKTWPMWIEAVAMNCDFWSRVCQSNSLRQMKFALGAVMMLRRGTLREIGGFPELADFIADDNRLGLLVHRLGKRVALTNVVVDCYSDPTTLKKVWDRQLRWARTIRACEPLPYFFSILANASLWLLLALIATMGAPISSSVRAFSVATLLLLLTVNCQMTRINGQRLGCRFPGFIATIPMILTKDAMGLGCWILAFLGGEIEWRGRRYQILRGGRLRAVD